MNSQSIDALRPELWGRELWEDAKTGLFFMQNGMMGEDDNNIIQIHTDLKKNNGDTKTIPLTAKLSRTGGVTGDDVLEGNEQRILPYSQSISIDQWRDAVRLKGRLDEKKNAYDMRMDAKNKLSILLQEWMELQFFLKLGGVTNTSLVDINGDVIGTQATWSNTPGYIPNADEAAGTGARYLCASSGGTTSLSSTDKMTPQLITRAKLKARLAKPRILPLRVNGKEYYVMFLHPWQAEDLRQNATFMQAQRDAEIRGKDNPIFTGALGIWQGVILYEHDYVPFLDVSVAGNSFRGAAVGTDCAVDCFRALLCGRQAGVFLEANNPNKWQEEEFDYGNQCGFSTGIIGGVQKTMFNSKEYGVIAVDTAASNYA